MATASTFFGMGGISVGDILNTWQQAGVFDYLLPFLLIFAVVYGILNKTKVIGENKGVQATISLSVGLLSLLNGYVTTFFASLFPYAGIAISVLLVALILMGLISNEKWSGRVWFTIGIIGFAAVVVASFSDMPFGIGPALSGSFPALIAGGILLFLMWMIVFGKFDKGESEK